MDLATLPRRLSLAMSGTAAAASIGLALSASCGAAHADTLEQALAAAYTGNPQLVTERATLEATNEQVPQALSNWRPTVSINATGGIDHQYNKTNCAAGDCDGYNNNYSLNLSPNSYGVTVTEQVFRGGRTAAATSQAINLVRAERANLVNTEQSVMLGVITDYLQVIEDEAILDLSRTNEDALKRLLGASKERKRLGELTSTDVALAQTSYSQAVASRQTAEGTLASARAAYERDVGEAPTELTVPTQYPEMPTSRDEATAIAMKAAPAVIQAEYTQEAAEDDIRLVQGQLLPTLSVQASVIRQKETATTGLTTTDKQVLATLSVPLYEGGSVYSQSRAAQKTVAADRSAVDNARRAAIEAAAQTWDQLQSARESIESLQDAVTAGQTALSGLEQQAAIGTMTTQDVLLQEESLFQTRVSLEQALYSQRLLTFSMSQALGRLTARNLGLDVPYYDPDKEYDAVRDKWIGFGTQ
jgi:outer membrane protein